MLATEYRVQTALRCRVSIIMHLVRLGVLPFVAYQFETTEFLHTFCVCIFWYIATVDDIKGH
jgi:hypothetical protein